MYPLTVNTFPNSVDLTLLPFAISPLSDHNLIGGSSYLCTQNTPHGKVYLKLPKYNSEMHCFTGHESITEVIVSRYLDVLGIPHLAYTPLFARVFIDGKNQETVVCVSEDFCAADEEQICLKDYYDENRNDRESVLDFCKRMGWAENVYRMILTDYLVLNRDRYANNLVLLKSKKTGTVRPSPLFDHGLCLLSETRSEEEAAAVHVLWDAISHMYIGSFRVSANLKLIPPECFPRTNAPTEKDRAYLFHDLEKYLSSVYTEKVWEMLMARYRAAYRI